MDMLKLAGCVILDKDNKILLLHRNTKKRIQWELPGGKIENKETSEQAAIREIKEELGITIEIRKKLGEKDFTEGDFTMNYTWFLTETIQGIPKVLETETFDDFKYFSWNEIEDMKEKLSENTKNLLSTYNLGEINI